MEISVGNYLLTAFAMEFSVFYTKTLKAPNKNASEDILISHFYLSKKIRLGF